MNGFPAALERLTEQFAKLPGIGGKTAQRLAFYLLSQPQEEAEEFADAGRVMTVVMLLLGNVTFLLLDRVLSKRFRR